MLHDPNSNAAPSEDLRSYKKTIQSMLTSRDVPLADFREAFGFAVQNIYGSHKDCSKRLGIGIGTSQRWEREGAPHAINRYAAIRLIAKDIGIEIPKAFSR